MQRASSILLMAAGQPFKPSSRAATWRLRWSMMAYLVAWHIALPAALVYFWLKGRKEPLYRQFLAERFGRLACNLDAPVWLHSASLGELRGVMPLIETMLAKQLSVLITTLTPAARQAAQLRFATAITEGKLQVSYLPLDLPWAVRRFARCVNARYMLSSEIDTWPVLLHTLKRIGLPLGLVNAQYPRQSYEKDRRGWGLRQSAFRQYDVVLCKSSLHAQRFLAIGCADVSVCGELRFDWPIAQNQLDAAARLCERAPLRCAGREVLCLASVIEGEDEALLDAFMAFSAQMRQTQHPPPLLIYVPRSPQRFAAAAQLLAQRKLRFVQRSLALDHEFNWVGAHEKEIDVLLGDSLGEMAFYLALADSVTVCGSFMPSGSHNVIEPLALGKRVIVGPSIWGIEYPGQEALAAGVLTQVQNAQELPAQWLRWAHEPEAKQQFIARVDAFMAEHSGATRKHWQRLSQWQQQVGARS